MSNQKLHSDEAWTLLGKLARLIDSQDTLARALGLAHDIGSVEAGKATDLCAWRVDHVTELAYWIGVPGPERRIFAELDA